MFRKCSLFLEVCCWVGLTGCGNSSGVSNSSDLVSWSNEADTSVLLDSRPKHAQVVKALILANAASTYSGSFDCVHNSRENVLGAAKHGFVFKFRSEAEVAFALIPRGDSAKAIGSELVQTWPNQLAKLRQTGHTGWHVVNVPLWRKNHTGLWPNGLVFSGGTELGHVTTHVSLAGAGSIVLDQYSTRAFEHDPALIRETLEGKLPHGVKPTTEPDLVNRVTEYAIFQWCHETWGCPDSKYFLDH